jgi:hypothetical protein
MLLVDLHADRVSPSSNPPSCLRDTLALPKIIHGSAGASGKGAGRLLIKYIEPRGYPLRAALRIALSDRNGGSAEFFKSRLGALQDFVEAGDHFCGVVEQAGGEQGIVE